MYATGAKRGKTRASEVLVLLPNWLKEWREFCQPIIERSKAKPKQTRNYFRHSIENRSMKPCHENNGAAI